MSFWRRSLLSI